MRPIMLILASFAAGILIHASLAQSYTFTELTLLIALIIFLVLALITSIKRLWGARFLIYPCFFLLGLLFILPNLKSDFEPGHISNFADKELGPLGGSFEGVLLKAPEISNGQNRLYAEVIKFYPQEGNPRDVHGRVRLKVAAGREGEPAEALSKLFRGDSIRFLAKLSRPINFNNPGGFDYEWWLARQGIFVTGRVPNENLLIKTAQGRPGLMRSMEIIRARVNRSIDGYSLENGTAISNSIIKALVTGERSTIDKDTREAFINTGTAHILAISGLHVGIVALFSFLIFFNIFRFSERLALAVNIKKLSWALALIPVGFYGMLAGLPVSTQRAMIMVSAFVLAYLLDRSRDLYATLALAALAVLALHPGSLWDASFQFSFSAVFAIFYLVGRFDKIFSRTNTEGIIREQNRRVEWLTHRVRILVFITVAASIATVPLSIYHFNNLPLIGMPLNLIVVPIVSLIIVPLSLLSVLLIPISETLSTFLLTIDDLFIDALVRLIKSVSKPEWSHIKVSTISIIEIASFYLIIFILFNIKKRRYLLYVLPILITGLTFPTVSHYYQKITNDELRVTFLNVGQGEASFIEFPGGRTMLIDGGASYRGGFDMGESVISPFLRKKRIKRIDYLVMSHAQRDHKGGLPFIARSFNIGEFWWNGKGSIPAITNALEKKDSPAIIMDSSHRAIDIDGVQVRILSPGPGKSAGLSLNEASLVIKLTYGEKSLLFTGDIGLETETSLDDTLDLNADILKAPHHGSRYSSSTAFLDEVTPGYVVISTGRKNSYGFPHKEALDRFLDIKARIFRTDRHGAVEAVIDGKKVELKSYKKHL